MQRKQSARALVALPENMPTRADLAGRTGVGLEINRLAEEKRRERLAEPNRKGRDIGELPPPTPLKAG